MIDYKFLEKLCTCNGISGDESAVRNLIINEIKAYADDIKIDNLGNLIVHKNGIQKSANKLMLSAHMDEVGFMITDITPDGYLKFDEVGGIDRRVVVGKQVTIGKKAVNGVIGIKPVHLSKGEDSAVIPKFSEMYIDIGADSREDALKAVSYGDSVNFVSDFERNATSIKAKALDDRFGCFVLAGLIKQELKYDMDFAFVVQEEVGLRGAKTAAYSLDPDFALVIETTTAADIPEIDKTKQVCNLGKGAVISVMDSRTVYDKEMIAKAFECAERVGAKAQYKRAAAGGNDAGVIHQSRSGVRTLAVSLPCRYLHAPSCIANIDDCESVIKLVSALSCEIAGGNLNVKGNVI